MDIKLIDLSRKEKQIYFLRIIVFFSSCITTEITRKVQDKRSGEENCHRFYSYYTLRILSQYNSILCHRLLGWIKGFL
jgi:hypothetical protein